MGPAVLCHSSQSSKTACGTRRRIPIHPFAHGCVSLAESSPTTTWARNWKGFSTCSWYAIHRQPRRSPRFYQIRGCHLPTNLRVGTSRGSNVTRHPSPLSMGGRSEATGETLGSEARSTTSQYDDDDEQSSGGGLPPIPEGEEGPPSPNATVSEARSALQELAEKAAEIKRLTSPVKSGKKSGGQSWLTH